VYLMTLEKTSKQNCTVATLATWKMRPEKVR
jgi:hypothetical protein